MTALVTGAAGFLGSHLCQALLDAGEEVIGLDCFTAHYDRSLKEANLGALAESPSFTALEADVGEIESLIGHVEVVYHLAGQPGVRPSWGSDFDLYLRHNVRATQRVLEVCHRQPIKKLVFASSSSVYGDAESYPTPETVVPQPVSPYGVTKLAAEHLCELYRKAYGIPTASLRLFTVYGPRQRPDMAFSRLVSAALYGRTFELYGDGEQTRDFTFVGDVVQAMLDVADSQWCGVVNIGGGARTSMNQVIDIVTSLTGPIAVERQPAQRGDARHTAADTAVASSAFGYHPRTTLADGLAQMVAYEEERQEVTVR
jgi:nucleoside-diphosphate-sugar epimerase